MLTLDKIYHAKYVLKQVIRETDVIHAPKINPESNIWLKTENLQITGSFKVRGAYYKMSCLSEEEKAKGVIACSAGNHAQGVALAAAKNGLFKIFNCGLQNRRPFYIAHFWRKLFPFGKVGGADFQKSFVNQYF